MDSGSEGADYPSQSDRQVTNIWNVTACNYCPRCGTETAIEHTEYETRVTCPEHGQLLLR